MFKKFAEKLSALAFKFSQQRHLNAIRDGFIILMPLIIIASFFILINNVVLNESNGLLALLSIEGSSITKLTEVGVRVYNGTLNFMSVLIAATVAYKLGKSYGDEGIIPAIFSVSSLLVFFPMTLNVIPLGASEGVEVAGLISGVHTSATGLFVGILISIVSTELLLRVSKVEKFKIKMPDSVPPSVAKSFNVLIPMTLVLTLLGFIAFFINDIFAMSLHDIVTKLIQMPLLGIMQGLPGILAILFFQNLLWAFGLHGAFILAPITETTLLVAIQENIAALQSGLIPPHIVTKPFLDAFGFMGGGGSTIGLVIAVFILSKRKDHRAISELSTVPSLFNINEPLMFGMPIVFNPILAIPLVLTPIVNISIAYFATYMGWIAKTTVLIPWTTPPVISAFLATNGDYRAAILAIICIVISVVIYAPFVLISNSQKEIEN